MQPFMAEDVDQHQDHIFLTSNAARSMFDEAKVEYETEAVVPSG